MRNLWLRISIFSFAHTQLQVPVECKSAVDVAYVLCATLPPLTVGVRVTISMTLCLLCVYFAAN